MLTDPVGAQSLLASWGGEVKLPVFVEANIHGGEQEGTDAMMQVIRDLVTLPYAARTTPSTSFSTTRSSSSSRPRTPTVEWQVGGRTRTAST